MDNDAMLVLAVADIHGNAGILRILSELIRERKPDALLIAGDLTEDWFSLQGLTDPEAMTNVDKIRRQKKSAQQIVHELAAMRCLTLLVPGNHDHPEIHPIFDSVPSVMNIDGRTVTLGGVEIIGFGGSNRTSRRLPYEWEEDAVLEKLGGMFSKSKGRVILLSHTPPIATVDEVPRFLEESTKLHVGSRAIRQIVESYKPVACICGHVHESAGVVRLSKTLVINPGSTEISGILQQNAMECMVSEITISKTGDVKASVFMATASSTR